MLLAAAVGAVSCGVPGRFELEADLLGEEGCDVRMGVAPLAEATPPTRFTWRRTLRDSDHFHCRAAGGDGTRSLRIALPLEPDGSVRAGVYQLSRDAEPAANRGGLLVVDQEALDRIRRERRMFLAPRFAFEGTLTVEAAARGAYALRGHLRATGRIIRVWD